MSASWQPIETVPVDERVLLALNCRVVIGELVVSGTWRMEGRPGVLTGYPAGLGPTHWQPLPPLPTE